MLFTSSNEGISKVLENEEGEEGESGVTPQISINDLIEFLITFIYLFF